MEHCVNVVSSPILGHTSAADPYTTSLSGLTNGAAYGAAAQPLTASAIQAAAAGVAGKQIEGKYSLTLLGPNGLIRPCRDQTNG